jgi:hypothetical protein
MLIVRYCWHVFAASRMIDNRLCLPCKFPYTRAAYINDNSAYRDESRRIARAHAFLRPRSRKRTNRGENSAIHLANALDGACNVRFRSAKVTSRSALRKARPAACSIDLVTFLREHQRSVRQSWKLGIVVAVIPMRRFPGPRRRLSTAIPVSRNARSANE